MKYKILSLGLLSCFANADVSVNGFSTIGLTKSSGDKTLFLECFLFIKS